MNAIGLNNVLNSIGDFSKSAQNIVNDQMQQKAQLDALAFQTQLETETNAFLQDLQKKPYGTDYNAEVNNYLQKIKGQMSDKNSPYYAANNYTADIYKKLLTQAQGNLQVQAQNISLKKETENSLLKAQSVMNWYRNNVSAQEAADKNFKVINYLKDKGYVSETDAYNMKTAEAQLDVLNNAQTDYLKLIEGGADPQTAEQAVLTKVTENFSTYQEEYSTGEMQKWIKSGITQAQNKIKQSQEINDDALIKENTNLITSLSETNHLDNIARLQNQINKIQRLPKLALGAEQYKARIMELYARINSEQGLIKTESEKDKKNIKNAFTLDQIQSDMANQAKDNDLLTLLNKYDCKDKSIYGLQQAYLAAFQDEINRSKSMYLNPEGNYKWDENQWQYKFNHTIKQELDNITNSLLKVTKLEGTDLGNFITVQEQRLKKAINDSKNTDIQKMDALELQEFMWDVIAESDLKTTKPEDIQKRFDDFIESRNLKNYDYLIDKKGNNANKNYDDPKVLAKALQQLNNAETVWTNKQGVDKWNVPVEDAIKNNLLPRLEAELKKDLNLPENTIVHFKWQQSEHDVEPVPNFYFDIDGAYYRFTSTDGKNITLEVQHSYDETKSWNTVAGVKPFKSVKEEVKNLDNQTKNYYNNSVNENMGATTNIVREIYDHINKLPKDQYQEIMKEIDPTYEMDSPEQQQDALRRYLLKNGNGNLDTETMHKNAQKLINRYKK